MASAGRRESGHLQSRSSLVLAPSGPRVTPSIASADVRSRSWGAYSSRSRCASVPSVGRHTRLRARAREREIGGGSRAAPRVPGRAPRWRLPWRRPGRPHATLSRSPAARILRLAKFSCVTAGRGSCTTAAPTPRSPPTEPPLRVLEASHVLREVTGVGPSRAADFQGASAASPSPASCADWSSRAA